MNIFRKSQTQNLAEWLEIATAKLSRNAKARISTDIASHYNEAVDGHLENGLPMPAAHAAALAELGDARAAARRFRREHLTREEYWAVDELLENARSYRRYGAGLALDLGLCWLFCLMVPDAEALVPGSNILRHVVVPLIVICSCANFVLARRKNAAPNTRTLVLMQSLRSLNLGMLLLTGSENYVLLSLLMFVCSLSCFQLRNKLGKVAEDWMGRAGEGRKEIPPEDPVAS